MPSGHVDKSKPLRPLSGYAWATLALCERRSMVESIESNPGVWDRLLREGLIEQAQTVRGVWYRITDVGRLKMRERP